MEINNQTKCIQDQVKWKEAAEKAKTFRQWSCSAWWRRRRRRIRRTKKVLFQHFPEKHKKTNKIQHLVKKASLWPSNNLQHSVTCYICPKIWGPCTRGHTKKNVQNMTIQQTLAVTGCSHYSTYPYSTV